MGIRYSKIEHYRNKREIVLLKSFPCKYGKCAFCNYIEDNSVDENEINRVNEDVLREITGRYGMLDVINSGSVFELPTKTLELIREISYEKNIKVIYFEVYYGYINRLGEIRKFFDGIEIRFRMGMETFDNPYRTQVLKKNFLLDEEKLEILKDKIYCICLLVGMKGQTKEMIRKDIEMGLKYFRQITVNIFVNNGTVVKRDEELCKWIVEEYKNLPDNPKVEMLLDNRALGVYEQ